MQVRDSAARGPKKENRLWFAFLLLLETLTVQIQNTAMEQLLPVLMFLDLNKSVKIYPTTSVSPIVKT
jgi:hypothetical protein